MNDHIYKRIEITGASTSTMEEAIRNAIERAHKTVHNMRWFEIVETRGEINVGRVAHWLVTIKIGFTLARAVTAR